MIVFANILTVVISLLLIGNVRRAPLTITFLSLIIFEILFVFPLLVESILGVAPTPYAGFKYAQKDVLTAFFFMGCSALLWN